MGKSLAVKRKRKFHGNRFSKRGPEYTTVSASKLKLPTKTDEKTDFLDSGNRNFDLKIMENTFADLCHKKKTIKKMKGIDLQTAKADHICRNHEGSAKTMKTVGALRIFKRSVKTRGLKYTKYYGDGDSSGFDVVMNTYGPNSVKKYECIGHIQKRVGA